MVNELDKEVRTIGLNMNHNKTKSMSNKDEEVKITTTQGTVEQVTEYLYLAQVIKNS